MNHIEPKRLGKAYHERKTRAIRQAKNVRDLEKRPTFCYNVMK